MSVYDVYYMKPEFFREFSMGDKLPSLATLRNTHTYLRSVYASSLDDVYTKQQAHNWAQDYKATNAMLDSLGLSHTSMSVGDVIMGENDGYVVANTGFTKLEG